MLDGAFSVKIILCQIIGSSVNNELERVWTGATEDHLGNCVE
jgi:hypothetical protein